MIVSVELSRDETGVGSGFKVDHEDRICFVPLDPRNPDYQRIKEWYEEQEPKPFEFDFDAPSSQ